MIVGIVSGRAESAFVNGRMDRDNSPVMKNKYSLAFLLSSCGWWIACNKAALVVSSIVLVWPT